MNTTASPKVVIVGAGSLFFGRKAIWQMIHSPALNQGTLGLVDIDADRLDRMARLAQMAIAHHDVPLKLQASTDRREVLADADFVVLSFAKNNAHYRGVDCEVSAKYGIRMCSGDTIGPGGIMRTAREFPQIIACCRDIEQLCPDAWVVNYINPAAVHGIGLKRFFPNLKSLTLCDAQFQLRQNYAQLANVPNDDKWQLLSAGPNHFTWLLEASYDGQDKIPAIIDAIRQKADEDANQQAQGGAAHAKGWMNNSIALELYDGFGVLPTVLGHTKEYVRYYQGRSILNADRHPALKLFEVPERLRWTQAVWDRVDAYLRGDVPINEFDTEFGPDPATDLIESMWQSGDRPSSEVTGKRFFVNQPNQGAVPNMSDDAFIELYSDVSMAGITPLACPPMPRGVRGQCEQVLDTHELTAEAVFKADRALLRRAFLTDPLTSSIGDTDALMDELLAAEYDDAGHRFD